MDDAKSLHNEARKLRESAEAKRKDANKAEINFHLYIDGGNQLQAALEEASAIKLRGEADDLEKQADQQDQKAADAERQASEVDLEIKNLQGQIDTLLSQKRHLLGE